MARRIYAFNIGDYVQVKDADGNLPMVMGVIKKRAQLLEPDTAPDFAKVYYVDGGNGELLTVREEEIIRGRLFPTDAEGQQQLSPPGRRRVKA